MLSSISYSYDDQGRQCAVTDSRNGTTTHTFNDEGQISSVLTPPPAPGQNGHLTTNFFDKMGRIWKTTLPDYTSVTNCYDLTGAITNKSGSREYPVAYTFDSQGRLQTMTTWTDYATRS